MKLFITIICFFHTLFIVDLLSAHQVVILGSGPAGPTAAIYASRAGLSPLLIEGEEPGGQIALSYMVDNFPGFSQGINGYELGANMREQALCFGTKIESGKVIKANLSQRPFKLELEDG
jgi:thioredoxin reductase (NADPH)